jgi:hypothetical protein
MRITIKIATVATVSVVTNAWATSIPVDLGPNGVFSSLPGSPPTLPLFVSFPAPDLQFQGQNIALDFTFQNSEFIRLFTLTKVFNVDVFLRINNAPSPQIFSGTGFVSDALGNALGPATSVQAFTDTNGANQIIGSDFFFAPSISLAHPVDIYGIHLDLTLPDSPGFGFGNGTFGAITLNADILGIGPNIPADVTPETGDAIGLLALGLTALMAIRWVFRRCDAGDALRSTFRSGLRGG